MRTALWAITVVLILLLPTVVGGWSDEAGGMAGRSEAAPVHRAAATPGPWPQYQHDAAHTGLAAAGPRGIQDPVVLWDLGISMDSLGTVLGDFRQNILLEGNVSAYTVPGIQVVQAVGNTVAILEGTTGETMWAVTLSGQVRAAPAVADLDRDARLDLVVATVAGNVSAYEPVIRFNGTGYNISTSAGTSDRLWHFPAGSAITDSSPALADVDNDGVLDVLVGATKVLWAINGTTGGSLWSFPTAGNRTTAPAVLPFSAQNERIVIQSFEPSPTDLMFVQVVNTKAQQLWNRTVPVTASILQAVLPSPAVGDLTGDNASEIVVASPSEAGGARIRVYDAAGGSPWPSPFVVDGVVEAGPSLADMDGDGKAEVVVAGWKNVTLNLRTTVYRIDGIGGTQDWSVTLDEAVGPLPERAVAAIALADLDRSGRPDLVVATVDGDLYGLSGVDGATLWRYVTNHYADLLGIVSGPALGDLNGDGILELSIDGLALTHRIADLRVAAADLSLSAGDLQDGQSVTLSSVVGNDGTKDTTNATVRLVDTYDGDVRTVQDVTRAVTAGSTTGVDFTFTIRGGGAHLLTVIADPAGDIEESREDNNQASIGTTVTSPFQLELTTATNESVVDAGAAVAYSIDVRNLGTTPNRIGLALNGTVSGWTATLSTSEVFLDVGETNLVIVSVQSPSTAPAGDYPVRLRGTSKNNTADHDTVWLTTTIRGQYGVRLAATPLDQPVVAEAFAFINLTVTNIGNDVDDISLAVTGAPAGWIASVSKSVVTLAGRTSAELSVIVKPPNAAPEGAAATLQITAESTGDPAKTDNVTAAVRVVRPDFAIDAAGLFRRDGVQADGAVIHLIADRPFFLNGTVSNLRGNLPAIAGLTLGVYRNGSREATATVTVTGSQQTPFSFPLAAPEGPTDIRVVADDSGFMAETDEGNNDWNTTTSLKSPTPVGPYDLTGAVWFKGARAPAADITVTNNATGRSTAIRSDSQGNYALDLATMQNGYQDDDRIDVRASNGITTVIRSFLAYSEDGGRRLDLVLVPRPGDFAMLVGQNNGRVAPGDSVTYNFTVWQAGSASNTITLQVETPNGWAGFFLRNGTAISNVTLKPDESAEIQTVVFAPEDAPAASISIVRVHGTASADPKESHQVDFHTTVDQVYRETVSGSAASGVAGTSVTMSFTVRNDGNGRDTGTLEVSGPAAWNVTVSPADFVLDAGSSLTVQVVARVPTNATAGTYTITVRARSIAGGKEAAVATGSANLTVALPSHGIRVEFVGASSDAAQPGNDVAFNLQIVNEGNARDTILISFLPVPNWSISLVDPAGVPWRESTLDPRGIASGRLRVSVPAEPERESVTILVQAVSAADGAAAGTAAAAVSVLAADLRIVGSVEVGGSVAGRAVQGQKTVVSVPVLNSGTVDAEDVEVDLFVDEVRVSTKVIASIAKDQQVSVLIPWTPKTSGPHTLKVVVNPDHAIAELRYGNNEVSGNFVVTEAGLSGAAVAGLALFLFIVVVAVVYLLRHRILPPSAGAPRRRRDRDEEDGGEEPDQEREEDEAVERDDDGEEEEERKEQEEDEGEEEGRGRGRKAGVEEESDDREEIDDGAEEDGQEEERRPSQPARRQEQREPPRSRPVVPLKRTSGTGTAALRKSGVKQTKWRPGRHVDEEQDLDRSLEGVGRMG